LYRYVEDIGVGTTGLVHRSKMKKGGGVGGGGGNVEPHDLFSAGQSVSVKVESVDMQRNRIGLALA
jgi:transcriptional accessory protein Tex/SPT6